MTRYAVPDWFLPSAAITAAVYIGGLWLMPYSGLGAGLPVLSFVTGWLSLMGGVALLGLTGLSRMLGKAGEKDLARAMIAWIQDNRELIAWTMVGVALYGLMAMGFNWVKAQLNFAFPFWADEMFAAMDYRLFGTDPFIPLTRMFGPAIIVVDLVYSLWFPALVVSLSWVLLRRDDVAITAYFLLWGVFGTLLQAMFSSAGPIFWSRIGLGDRFDALFETTPFSSQYAADYLWTNYTAGDHALGGGISAMPSMHVGMAGWIALSFARTRWRWFGYAYLAIVFVGSIALGWHYFVDGAVGVLSAIASFGIAHAIMRGRKHLSRSERRGPEAEQAA